MAEKPLVGLYVRVSTQEQAKEGYSIDEQKDRLTKFCDAHDWTVAEIYADPGFSGAKLDRPAIQKLISDVEEHKLDKVLVYKLDRLSRSQKDTLYLIEDVFVANSVDFVSMTENFNTDSPFGKAMIGMLSVFAQLEREEIKERTMTGREGRVKAGLWSGGGKPPTGYRYENGQLIVEPYDAEIVKRIFKEYLSGKTIESITRGLNRDGIRSRYGPLQRTNVHDILANSTYAGYVHFNGQNYPGKHDALVSVDDWKQAEAKLKESADNDKIHLGFSNRVSAIAGLCYCGECGQKMVSRYWKKKDGTNVKNLVCMDKAKTGCTAKPFRRDDVEEAVLSQVRKLRLDPRFLKKSRSKKKTSDTDKTIKVYEEKIESNKKKISRYIDLYGIGGVDLNDLNAKITAVTVENETLTHEIDVLRARKDHQLTDEEITDDVIRLEKYLDEKNANQARAVIVCLIDRIILKENTVTIKWKF